MAEYRICPACGAYLDPGEPCDCRQNLEALQKAEEKKEDEEDTE